MKEVQDAKTPEALIIEKPVRVVVKGEDEAKAFKPGQEVIVSGNDKVQLLASKMARRKNEPKDDSKKGK